MPRAGLVIIQRFAVNFTFGETIGILTRTVILQINVILPKSP